MLVTSEARQVCTTIVHQVDCKSRPHLALSSASAHARTQLEHAARASSLATRVMPATPEFTTPPALASRLRPTYAGAATRGLLAIARPSASGDWSAAPPSLQGPFR